LAEGKVCKFLLFLGSHGSDVCEHFFHRPFLLVIVVVSVVVGVFVLVAIVIISIVVVVIVSLLLSVLHCAPLIPHGMHLFQWNGTGIQWNETGMALE